MGIIHLEKNQASIIQVYSSYQKDILFTLHENGSICLWSKQKTTNFNLFHTNTNEPIGNNFEKVQSNFLYSLLVQSDMIRLSKNTKVFGFSVCPVSQKYATILLNDGRVLKYELMKKVKYNLNYYTKVFLLF